MTIRPIPASREEWLGLRAKNVGASEVAAIFGVQPPYALSHYALWHVKAGLAPPPEVGGARVEWGLRLEAVIAEIAAAEREWKIAKGGYITDDECLGLACTLDYVAHSTETAAIGCLECKNADWLAHRRSWTDDEPPLHILLQLQAQLACTGYQWGAVACLVGGNDMRIYDYQRRPKLITEIRSRVAAFWQSIAENRPPTVDGSDSASASLRALYAEHTEEVADLETDNELPVACAAMLQAVEARKAAEKAEKEAKNRILAKLGPHLRARARGFFVNVAVTPEKPRRIAEPGEIINGRAESRRITVKEAV
jgi:predicted phage-related endonuclease